LKVIGITGGIGSGKSIICSIIEKRGYPVFYSDTEAKRILVSNKEVKLELTNLIGPQLYKGEIFHKEVLADKIFKDESIRLKVNQLIHPKVRESFNEWMIKQDSSLVFNEAAILFETGMYKQYDATILVTAPKSIRIKRTIKRDNTTAEAVQDRINNQWSDDEKKELADFVIINDDLTPVLQQIEEIIGKLNC
jgi:dephospho-CoA kinase